jgi:hypothetical protein
VVDVQFWITDVHVAPDDLVACVGFVAVAPVVTDQVIVIHIAMNAAEAIEINIIYPAVNDFSIDLDDRMAAVDVNVGNANDRSATGDPAAAMPAMIVDAMPVPITIVVQPDPNGKGRTKKNHARRI